jgi:hypothetical protein
VLDKFDGLNEVFKKQANAEFSKLSLSKGIDLKAFGGRNVAWEGTLIKNFMSITSIASIAFTILDIVISATAPPDPTQKKLDFIVETVYQINGTVTETLERVKDVQVSMQSGYFDGIFHRSLLSISPDSLFFFGIFCRGELMI